MVTAGPAGALFGLFFAQGIADMAGEWQRPEYSYGYLVPPNNAKLLGQSIAYALGRDAAMVEAMSDFAKKHVREHFSSERMKTSTIAVYRELLDGGK